MVGKRRALALVLTGALAVAACGGDDDTASTGTSSASDGSGSGEDAGVCTEDRKGGEITIAPRGVGATLDSYSALLGSIASGWEGLPIYSQLMRFDPESAEYVPHVAKAMTPNDDASEWTLELDEKVEFGNGDPLDADALIAHFDRHMAEDSTSQAKRVNGSTFSSYEKVDDWTVRFVLPAPNGAFPAVLAGGAGSLGLVQNVNVVEEMGAEEFAKLPKGGGVGPYEIDEWSPPERIVLKAKEDWWGGPVCIEKVTVTLIPDLRAAYDAYKQDEVDLFFVPRDPALLAEAGRDGDVAPIVYNAAFFAMPNLGVGGYTGPMADVRVRKAMVLAIDPEVINQRAWGGVGAPGTGLVHESSLFLEPTEGPEPDPDEARRLLDEYKRETGWDGSISAISAGTPAANREASLAIEAMLENVGFVVESDFDQATVPLMTAVLMDRKFELVASWGLNAPETEMFKGFRNYMSDAPAPLNGYSSPAFDAAMAKLREATDLDTYQAALEEMQQVINDEAPFAIYGASPEGSIYDGDRIKGLIWSIGPDPVLDKAYLVEG